MQKSVVALERGVVTLEMGGVASYIQIHICPDVEAAGAPARAAMQRGGAGRAVRVNMRRECRQRRR